MTLIQQLLIPLELQFVVTEEISSWGKVKVSRNRGGRRASLAGRE